MTTPTQAATPSRSRWALVAVLLFVAVGAVLAGNAVDDARAANRPGVDLVYPGSVEITRQTTSTATRLMLGSSATPEEVLRFYLAEVRSRGYLYGGSTMRIPWTTEDFACAWHNDDTIVRLAVLDPNVLAQSRRFRVATPRCIDGTCSI